MKHMGCIAVAIVTSKAVVSMPSGWDLADIALAVVAVAAVVVPVEHYLFRVHFRFP